MALTLSEGAKLSEDILLKGVIETIIKDSPVLQKMPFVDVVGNSLKYNRENALPTAAFYAVGDTWAESTPTFSQMTATISILGGDADVDNYLQQTRSNIQDIQAAVIELKAKALRQKFEQTFIYGTTDAYIGLTADANSFAGLLRLIVTGTASAQVIAMGATGATLTLAKLDELIDAVRGGKPDLLLMSRRSRRKLATLMRALGSIEVGQDEFGNFVQLYNGIPVAVNDWILDTHTLAGSVETLTTGSVNSTIYAFQVGEGAVCGLQNKSIQVENIGALETKDATRTRLKWYCSLADFSQVKRAALIGVQD